MPSMSGLSIELLAGRAAAAGDEVEDAGRDAGFADHFARTVAEQRRRARRLEDDGVAGDERAARGSRRQREREVERRDHRPDAVRAAARWSSVHRHRASASASEPVVRFDLIAVVGHQIRRLFDVADAFEPVLAGLVAHERRQLPPVLADAVRDLPESATRSCQGRALHAG